METIFSVLTNQLSAFLLQEGNRLGGLRHQVQHISDELGHIRAFLKVAEAKEDDDPRIHEWMKQVREVTYDIEDVLDEFKVLFPHHVEKGFFHCLRKIRLKTIQARHQIAGEVESIKLRIRNISEGHQRYRADYGTNHHFLGSPPITNTRWDDQFPEGRERLVGIRKPMRELISQLLDDDSRLKVISVLGSQGIGKTTLVKNVHEDANVRKQFEINAWTTTTKRGIKEVLQDLIQQICDQIKKLITSAFKSMTNLALASYARDLLQGKRYRIVFDDVCDMNTWNSIISGLPESGNGSRVVVTTRLADALQASSPSSQGYVYRMKHLSAEDSWSLFCNKTFKDSSCPAGLEAIARNIWSKCQGLPLAIVAIAGILASKDKKDAYQWEAIRDALGGEELTMSEQDLLKKVLHLSYQDLPYELKNCLLYMSIFPEDYDIQCHRLIQLWIAERFVEESRGKTTEEVAFHYLKELIRRNLVRVTEVSWDGSPNLCRIHNTMQEFILHKSEEQNMITLIATGHPTRVPEKVNRLVITNSLHYSQLSTNFKHLRSIITFGTTELTLLFELLSSKPLKVLDLRDILLDVIPDQVFNLIHLRYLSLRGTLVKAVPKSIKKLQNLEHLHLGQTDVRELPKEICKLQKLRHLRVFRVIDFSEGNYGFKAPSKIGELFSLHSLLSIDAQNDETTIVQEIGKLIQLRELGITKLKSQDGKELCSSLQRLTNLCELDVTAIAKDEVLDMDHLLSPSLQNLRELTLRGKLLKFPQWINSLQSLMKIDLIWSRLSGDDPVQTLQHLPRLVTVCLSQAYEGESLCFRAGGFLKLETLNLANMEGLKMITVEDGAMPHLRQLYMSELPQVKELPLGIQCLTALQSLHLNDTSSELTEKLQNTSVKTEVIAHVKEVVIGFRAEGEWKEHRL